MRNKKTLLLIISLMMIMRISSAFSVSPVHDFILSFGREKPVSFQLHAEIIKLPQFDEVRTEKLNRLLKHIDFAGIIDPYLSEITMMIDGTEMFSLFETGFSEKQDTVLATEPGHYYLVPSGQLFPTPFRSGSMESIDILLRNRSILSSLDEFASFFCQLPQDFPEKSSQVKILEKYKDYGTAVKRVSINLSGEEFTDYIQKKAGTGSAGQTVPDLSRMVFVNRQGFSLLFTEDDRLIKINYSGKAGYSEQDIRTVRLEWKTVRNEFLEKDELVLRTPNSAGTKRNNFILEHSWKRADDGSETFLWNAETDDVAEGARTRRYMKCELASDANGLISGNWSDTVNANREESVKGIDLLSIDSADDHCSGILEIISKKDKIECDRIRITFDLSAEVPVQVSADQPIPEAVSPEQYSALQESVLRKIVVAMMDFPESDLIFLKEGIPDESWDMIKGTNN